MMASLGIGCVQKAVESLRRLDLAQSLSATELEQVVNSPPIEALRSACLTPRSEGGPGFAVCNLGMSAGSGALSLNLRQVRRPAKADVAAPRPTPEAGEQDPALEEDQRAIRGLATMLALAFACHPEQRQLEAAWEGQGLLANYCVEILSKQVGLAIFGLRWNARSGALRAQVCADKSVNDKLSGMELWRYAPNYLEFFAEDGPPELPPKLIADRAEQLARAIVDDIWRFMATSNYFVDEELRGTVDTQLLKYVSHGILGPGEEFTPPPTFQLRLFLQGAAGVGKSSFTALICQGLQVALQKHVCPHLQSNIVKVPLNSISSSDLQHILRIQGISDWSIERMLEQSIAKHNLVVLHLEEVPFDDRAQKTMFNQVQDMVNHLLQRYPERPGFVLTIATSNYDLTSSLHPQFDSRVVVKAPSALNQRVWASNMLSRSLGGIVKVHIDDDAAPPASQDMRPLNNWWQSIGFHASKLSLKEGDTLHISRSNTEAGVLELVVDSDRHAKVVSEGGFFYLEHSSRTEITTPVSCVFDMTAKGWTSPGVVVFDYSNAETVPEDCAERVSAELVRVCGELNGVHLRVKDLGTLEDESDKAKLYGDQSEIRGGLVKFIDDTVNPHVQVSSELGDCKTCGQGVECSATTGEKRVAGVIARVNNVGQFMLRELLEAGDKSRTHRLAISKRYVIYCVILLPGHSISPQTLSRAMVVEKH